MRLSGGGFSTPPPDRRILLKWSPFGKAQAPPFTTKKTPCRCFHNGKTSNKAIRGPGPSPGEVLTVRRQDRGRDSLGGKPELLTHIEEKPKKALGIGDEGSRLHHIQNLLQPRPADSLNLLFSP